MKAEEVREALSVDPKFLNLAELLRAKFDAKLVWLKTSTVQIGKPVVGAVVVSAWREHREGA